MSLFLQRVLDGVRTGCIYAALALAIVLVFRRTGMLNFAQGEMAMLAIRPIAARSRGDQLPLIAVSIGLHSLAQWVWRASDSGPGPAMPVTGLRRSRPSPTKVHRAVRGPLSSPMTVT